LEVSRWWFDATDHWINRIVGEELPLLEEVRERKFGVGGTFRG
jgi:hypothetical protein